MQKNGAALGSDARFTIEYLRAFLLHFAQGAFDIRHFQADMVQTFPAFLQKAAQTRGGRGWLDQLYFAAAWTSHWKEGDTYLFAGNLFDFTGHDTECVAVKG